MAVMRERGLHAALNTHLLPVMASMYVTTSEIMHCKSGSIWQTCKGSPVCVWKANVGSGAMPGHLEGGHLPTLHHLRRSPVVLQLDGLDALSDVQFAA